MTILKTAPFGQEPSHNTDAYLSAAKESPLKPDYVACGSCKTLWTCATYGCQRESRAVVKEAEDPFSRQVGGTHYKGFAIQPTSFIVANGLDFCTGNVIKYVVRRKGDKAKRIEDLNKAKHYIDILIAQESN